jgi:hypothetical protein
MIEGEFTIHAGVKKTNHSFTGCLIIQMEIQPKRSVTLGNQVIAGYKDTNNHQNDYCLTNFQ